METAIPEFSISYKNGNKLTDLPVLKNSYDIAQVCRACFEADNIGWVESMIILALNAAFKPMGFYKLSTGGATATVCDAKVVFTFALLSNATKIVLAHNHPSSNVKPSRADEALTMKIKQAGNYLDIQLVDHIIVGEGDFYSFSDMGMI